MNTESTVLPGFPIKSEKCLSPATCAFAPGEKRQVLQNAARERITSALCADIHFTLDRPSDNHRGLDEGETQPQGFNPRMNGPACPVTARGIDCKEEHYRKYYNDPVKLGEYIDTLVPHDEKLYKSHDPRLLTNVHIIRDFGCKVPIDLADTQYIAEAVLNYYPDKYVQFLGQFVSNVFGKSMKRFLSMYIDGYQRMLSNTTDVNIVAWNAYLTVRQQRTKGSAVEEIVEDHTIPFDDELYENFTKLTHDGRGMTSQVSPSGYMDIVPCIRQHILTIEEMRDKLCMEWCTTETNALAMMYFANEQGLRMCWDRRLLCGIEREPDYDRICLHVPVMLNTSDFSVGSQVQAAAQNEPNYLGAIHENIKVDIETFMEHNTEVVPVGNWSGNGKPQKSFLKATPGRFRWGWGHPANVVHRRPEGTAPSFGWGVYFPFVQYKANDDPLLVNHAEVDQTNALSTVYLQPGGNAQLLKNQIEPDDSKPKTLRSSFLKPEKSDFDAETAFRGAPRWVQAGGMGASRLVNEDRKHNAREYVMSTEEDELYELSNKWTKCDISSDLIDPFLKAGRRWVEMKEGEYRIALRRYIPHIIPFEWCIVMNKLSTAMRKAQLLKLDSGCVSIIADIFPPPYTGINAWVTELGQIVLDEEFRVRSREYTSEEFEAFLRHLSQILFNGLNEYARNGGTVLAGLHMVDCNRAPYHSNVNEIYSCLLWYAGAKPAKSTYTRDPTKLHETRIKRVDQVVAIQDDVPILEDASSIQDLHLNVANSKNKVISDDFMKVFTLRKVIQYKYGPFVAYAIFSGMPEGFLCTIRYVRAQIVNLLTDSALQRQFVYRFLHYYRLMLGMVSLEERLKELSGDMCCEILTKFAGIAENSESYQAVLLFQMFPSGDVASTDVTWKGMHEALERLRTDHEQLIDLFEGSNTMFRGTNVPEPQVETALFYDAYRALPEAPAERAYQALQLLGVSDTLTTPTEHREAVQKHFKEMSCTYNFPYPASLAGFDDRDQPIPKRQMFAMLDSAALLWQRSAHFNSADTHRPKPAGKHGDLSDMHPWCQTYVESFLSARERFSLNVGAEQIWETTVKREPSEGFSKKHIGSLSKRTFKRLFPLLPENHAIRDILRKIRSLNVMWGDIPSYRSDGKTGKPGAWMPISEAQRVYLLDSVGLFDRKHQIPANPWILRRVAGEENEGLCKIYNQSYHSVYPVGDNRHAPYFCEWVNDVCRYRPPNQEECQFAFSMYGGTPVEADFLYHKVQKPNDEDEYVKVRHAQLLHDRFGFTKPMRLGQQINDEGILQDLYSFQYRNTLRLKKEQLTKTAKEIYPSNFMAYARNHAIIALASVNHGTNTMSDTRSVRNIFRLFVDSYRVCGGTPSYDDDHVPLIVGFLPNAVTRSTDRPITMFAGSLPCINAKIDRFCFSNMNKNEDICQRYKQAYLNDATLLFTRLMRSDMRRRVHKENFSAKKRSLKGSSPAYGLNDFYGDLVEVQDSYIEFLQTTLLTMCIESGVDVDKLPLHLLEPRDIIVSIGEEDTDVVGNDFLGPRTTDVLKDLKIAESNHLTKTQLAVLSLLPPQHRIMGLLRYDAKTQVLDLEHVRKQIQKGTIEENKKVWGRHVENMIRASLAMRFLEKDGPLDPSLDETAFKNPLTEMSRVDRYVATSNLERDGTVNVNQRAYQQRQGNGPTSLMQRNRGEADANTREVRSLMQQVERGYSQSNGKKSRMDVLIESDAGEHVKAQVREMLKQRVSF